MCLIRSAVLVFLLGHVALCQTTSDEFFDNSVIQEIKLEVQTSDWQALRDSYLLNTNYPADFTWNGITVRNVGIRSRGSGSRSPQKPNLRVRFDQYVSGERFLGLRTIHLKANNQDASMLGETVGFAFMRRMGLAVPREAHARLFINGEFFGLYVIVEPIDEWFLDRVYGESGGYLWEYNAATDYHFEYLGEDPTAYLEFFQPQTHENSPDTQTLIELIRRVNFASDEEFYDAVSPYLNLKGFMKLIAVENYIADNDGVLSAVYGMNNFYLYRYLNMTEAEVIPWDIDLSFSSAGRSAFMGIEENVLARRAFAVPELRQIYIETLVQAASLAGGHEGWLEQEIRRQYALIAEDARRDPHKQCFTERGIEPCADPAEAFEESAGRLITFPSLRSTYVLEEVGDLLSSGSPALQEGGVVNAATGAPMLAPGSLATLHGSSFATTITEVELLPLPLELAGVSVTLNGIRAPILFVSPFQVNFQVPWSVAEGTVSLSASVRGSRANTIEVAVARTAPGIFAVVHGSNSGAITPAYPAVAGEVITIYGTGLGQVSPQPMDGEAPESLSITVETPEVTIGERPARVLFAGLAPEMVGVYQVNVEVPEVPAGTGTGLTLKIGGETSPHYVMATK